MSSSSCDNGSHDESNSDDYTDISDSDSDVMKPDPAKKLKLETHVHAALLNDVVLERIFSNLEAENLATCRRVCKKWLEPATKLFVKHLDEFPIVFKVAVGKGFDSDSVEDEDESDDGQPELALSDYFGYLNDDSTVKSGEHCIKYSNFFFDGVDMTDLTVQEFLQDFGSTIKILKINLRNSRESRAYHAQRNYGVAEDEAHNSDIDDPSEDASQLESDDDDSNGFKPFSGKNFITVHAFQKILFEQCPNLEKLAIISLPMPVKIAHLYKQEADIRLAKNLKSISIHHFSRTDFYTTRFMTDLFRCCPNLMEVRSTSNYDSEPMDFKVVQSLIRAKRLDSLKNLMLTDPGNRIFKMLSESNAKFETVEFSNVRFYNQATAEEFLRRQSDSLQHLSLGRVESALGNGAGGHIIVHFPKMKELRNFSARIYNSGRGDCVRSFAAFDFTYQFPSLTELEIGVELGKQKKVDLFDDIERQDPHLILRKLTLPKDVCNPNIVVQIARVFPNILHLNIETQDDETIVALWNAWPKLEELHLGVLLVDAGHFCNKAEATLGLDSVLTGIPTDVCQQIQKRRKYFQYLGNDLPKIRQNPSIVNMKFLKRLIIHGGHYNKIPVPSRLNGDKATDLAGYLALTQLPSLNYLYLDKRVFELSDTCIDILSQELDMYLMGGSRRAESVIEFMRFPSAQQGSMAFSDYRPRPKWHDVGRQCVIC